MRFVLVPSRFLGPDAPVNTEQREFQFAGREKFLVQLRHDGALRFLSILDMDHRVEG